jgi:hypothetical protein
LSDPQNILAGSNAYVGGWENYRLAKYLKDRVYNGINEEYKRLLKLAKVPTTMRDSNGAIMVNSANSYLFLPAFAEISSDQAVSSDWQNPELYLAEAAETSNLDNFTMPAYWPCATPDGVARKYWLRSMTSWSNSNFYAVNPDQTINYTSGSTSKPDTYIRFMFTI